MKAWREVVVAVLVREEGREKRRRTKEMRMRKSRKGWV
jgi:hypothetical protein